MSDFLTAPRPIRRVLIANRGEIACRIIATCHRLGLTAIAVHSEADASARHVRLADEAVAIGPAPAAESYLSIERILAAARASGADAIHPGYGFLSENPRFVSAIEAAGLIYVGPDAEAVSAMGSKIAARHIAETAGVPVVPGFDGEGADDATLDRAAETIGYPVLVKASAGGGGRGMRRVMRPEDLSAALASARAEAASAFGDATVFLEKLIQNPRHIEVQVFGDGKGGALHFHERDCSVQRNHQKVIEEAPAPNLPDAVRQALFSHALSLTSAIRYAGAGTVEFVMAAGDTHPYFLEMNTRLQVEHPVTEMICGVDLVEWQLRQAAGLPLPLTQDQIRPRGHAIELRLNAERPETGFLPDTGTITRLASGPGLRFDTGVETGDAVSSHYDSMIAKLIAHGADREAALDRLCKGIDGTQVAGVGTNLGLLRDCLTTPAFAEGKATTGFLEATFPEGWRPDPDTLLRLRGSIARAAITGADDPLTRTDSFRIGAATAPGRALLQVVDDYGAAEIALTFGPAPEVSDGGRRLEIDPALTVFKDGNRHTATLRGLSVSAEVRPLAEARLDDRRDTQAEGIIAAPLTGLVTEIRVATGDRVTKGDTLAVMEAMKLVHALPAPFAARVARIAVTAGQTVAQKTILIELEEESA
ncbi:ATP-binding protein [Seohaeicola zhoushanensis]|uniref:3-methylcrotonyl-CoA carboxylase subunit alpha n=1 Tax=Seohaeicola zhoushanensis TaxID=1569283 RepID=A0A8J3MAX1_9RHOB|nr:biotin carboxylase N-terminal domain-containing protein [Seohaeicola zhoushanensis]GHF60456.1 3-methylcrotonyl-CoA carboxylase subunit alpha [Seohaeicola zhoushanensis]